MRMPFRSILALPVCALAPVMFASFAEAACTPTGFFRDGGTTEMTAALYNPPGKVTGDIDAGDCLVAIYYGPGAKGKVENANIHRGRYFGIVNNGAEVDVKNSTISDIGENPFNGTQHGVAIYFFGFDRTTKGNIKGNTIWNYQKGGIVVNGPFASSDIHQNTVIGFGPVKFIAQNGIQAGYGAKTKINQNFVSGNSYSGPNFAASGGILLVGGDCYGGDPTINTQVQNNTVVGNDVGAFLSNLAAGCGGGVLTPTKNKVENNTLINNAVYNKTGNGPTQGYQAGVSDAGNQDSIQNNSICGPGYTFPGDASAALFAIDVTPGYAINPTVKNNTGCAGHGEGYEHVSQPRSRQSARRAPGAQAAGIPTPAPVE